MTAGNDVTSSIVDEVDELQKIYDQIEQIFQLQLGFNQHFVDPRFVAMALP
jgi:hypothetical protein